ncbi:ParB/RepB/Spo0J family partition protein [Massilia sp. CCM 8734]|uniref:ParB/RepB/Spo0J family partition protein n=1 Tax=Massilia sp. CCM 8734 TaxID=2609283 RepID=UPI00141E2100|nr:ParB/RepB/Spo0J family partition protein [Massilia sp. CCM 8734]NHZ99075.1 ParB/RepB/Spo0J family partition protein [Massilia sp. CCM 8734]
MTKPSPLGNLSKLSDVAKTATKADAFIKIEKIYAVAQVRTIFRNLDQLADDFRINGILQPVVVHEESDGRYRLIIGERRFRAAPLAGLTEIPVRIKRGLTEVEMRAMQVAENEIRDDLTPYERAMGVIHDVDVFGVKEAMKIWKVESEGWISKRVGVKRYLPVTLSILVDELCGDLEILISINKIEHLDIGIAREYRQQLERGESLHRDTVRSRLNMMELQRKEQDQRQAQVTAAAEQAAEVAGETDSAASAKAEVVILHETRLDPVTKTTANQGTTANVTKLNVAPKRTPHVDAAEAAARERTEKGERLYGLREELFDYGRDNESCFQKIQELMFDLNHSPEDGEWVLWTGFLDMALPMLERLGPERTNAYLKRLQVELKGTTPAVLWTQLHPGCAIDDPATRDTPVPAKPEGWKF